MEQKVANVLVRAIHGLAVFSLVLFLKKSAIRQLFDKGHLEFRKHALSQATFLRCRYSDTAIQHKRLQ